MQWVGTWWKPTDTQNSVVGRLEQEPTGRFTLTLSGGIEGDESTPLDEFPEWEILHGRAAGRQLTLLTCRVRRESRRGDRLSEQEVIVHWVLEGIHLRELYQTIFTRLEVQIENLYEFSRTYHYRSYPNGKIPRRRNGFRYQDYEISLDRSVRESHGHRQRRGSFQTELRTASISIVPPSQAKLEDLLQHLRPLQDLVSFAAQRPCGVLNLEVSARRRGVNYRDLRVIYSGIAKPQPEMSAATDYLFGLADLGFGRMGSKWMKLRSDYAAPVNMLLSLLYWGSGPVETRLLTAVTSAEALHRKSSRLLGLPDRDHKNVIASADKLSEPARTWTLDRVSRNDPTLEERLIDLAERHNLAAANAVLPDIARWASVAKKLRNNVAHGLKPTDPNKADEALAVIATTSAIASIAILTRLGVPGEQVLDAAIYNSQFKFARSLARKHLRSS